MINIIKYSDFLNAKQLIKIKLNNSKIEKQEVKYIDFALNKDLEIEILQNNLFNPIKAVVIYNATFLNSADDFKNYKYLFNFLNKYKLEFNFFLFSDKKILTNSEFKNLTKDFQLDELKEITETEKVKIINEELKKENLILEKNVYAELINNIDCNYGNIKNEIKKISLLSKSKTDDLEIISLISNYNDENIFQLFESILSKKHSMIWKIYIDLLRKKQDEIMIINAFGSQLFNIYYVLRLLKENKSISFISEISGISTYFINMYKNKFICYNIGIIENMIADLYKLEVDIKLMKVDKSIAFKKFILNASK